MGHRSLSADTAYIAHNTNHTEFLKGITMTTTTSKARHELRLAMGVGSAFINVAPDTISKVYVINDAIELVFGKRGIPDNEFLRFVKNTAGDMVVLHCSNAPNKAFQKPVMRLPGDTKYALFSEDNLLGVNINQFWVGYKETGPLDFFATARSDISNAAMALYDNEPCAKAAGPKTDKLKKIFKDLFKFVAA